MSPTSLALIATLAACGSSRTDPTVVVAPARTDAAGADAAIDAEVEVSPPLVKRSIDGVDFLETTTGGAQLTDRAPLIIVLHGQGGDPADLVALVRTLGARAHVVLPYADPANGELSWYRGESTDAGAPGVRVAAARIARVLGRFVDAHAVAGKPIVIGYSQGAIVALALSVIEAPRLAAVVSMSGRLPPALFAAAARVGPERPTVDEFHGDHDRAVPYAAARDSIAALTSAGFSAQLHTYPGGHELSPREVEDVLALLEVAVAPRE